MDITHHKLFKFYKGSDSYQIPFSLLATVRVAIMIIPITVSEFGHTRSITKVLVSEVSIRHDNRCSLLDSPVSSKSRWGSCTEGTE